MKIYKNWLNFCLARLGNCQGQARISLNLDPTVLEKEL